MNIDKRVALSPIKIDNANTLRLHKKQSCRYKIKPLTCVAIALALASRLLAVYSR